MGKKTRYVHNQARRVLELLGELLPDGREALAVAAPGGVELHEHVLVVVVNDVLEALADDSVHRLVLFGRNGLALELGRELTLGELLSVRLDGVG